jgi:UPF0271 protein
MKFDEAVVDANVLIHSRGQLSDLQVYAPSSVIEELRSTQAKMNLEKMDLKVEDPSQTSLDKVESKSREICSPTSGEDEEALALAMEKDIGVVTDDKALQNLALHMKVDYQGFNTEKVQERREWKKVCQNCGREVSGGGCSFCGASGFERKREG